MICTKYITYTLGLSLTNAADDPAINEYGHGSKKVHTHLGQESPPRYLELSELWTAGLVEKNFLRGRFGDKETMVPNSSGSSRQIVFDVIAEWREERSEGVAWE